MNGLLSRLRPRLGRRELRQRRLLDRSRLLRELRAFTLIRRTSRQGFDLSHLPAYAEQVIGPIQRDEAVALFGLLRVLRPLTVVEFGFQTGQSSFNFLRALDDEARLYSFDINAGCEKVAERRFGHDPRFRLLLKSQETIEPQDVDGRPVDFVFIDAAHDSRLNQITFERLLPMLSPTALIAIHDTGTVPRELFPSWHWLLDTEENWVDGHYEGQPGEREFVNWMLDEHPEFSQLHLHSERTLRHGITLLQRSAKLARSDAPSVTAPSPQRTAPPAPSRA